MASPAAPFTTVGIDTCAGTTTDDLWLAAIGMTSEATARQHPRPGVTYRPVRDTQPVLWLAWWRDKKAAHAA